MIRQTDIPALGNTHVRAYLEDPDTAPPELKALADEWIERQAGLQFKAQELVEQLEAIYPTPSPAEIISGGAVFPPWHGDPHWDVLRHWPWAEHLDEAVEKGGEWLEREVGTQA